jgi:1,4-alpha-glucan branching enzyme
VVRHEFRVGMPKAGRWREVINSDAGAYGGSDVGNLGMVTASETPWNSQPCSAVMSLPPLAVLWLTPEDGAR